MRSKSKEVGLEKGIYAVLLSEASDNNIASSDTILV